MIGKQFFGSAFKDVKGLLSLKTDQAAGDGTWDSAHAGQAIPITAVTRILISNVCEPRIATEARPRYYLHEGPQQLLCLFLLHSLESFPDQSGLLPCFNLSTGG